MIINGDVDRPAPRSHLFVLRLWVEDLGSGQTDLRGKVQHVNSGEARYFRDWPTLETFVERLMLKINLEQNPAGGIEETDSPSPPSG